MVDCGTELTIRRAHSHKAGDVHDLMQRSFHKYIERMGRKPTPMTDDYEEIMRLDFVWVAEEADGLAAAMVLRPQASSLCLETLAVDPAYQGNGIGSRLMDIAETEAVKFFHDRVILCTHETMVENAALYTRRGYIETHRVPKMGTKIIWFEKIISQPLAA